MPGTQAANRFLVRVCFLSPISTITLTEVKVASYWASCQFMIREIFYVIASFLFFYSLVLTAVM